MGSWTLAQIPWHDFDATRLDPHITSLIKTAALVEYNGADYATYLCNIFHGDEAFCNAVRHWAAEEVQHGEALGRWAETADPDFDFQAAFRRFTAGYRLPLEATRSVRGSRSGELIARCVVEAGTSSYYSALADAADEPVAADICRRIAADEFRHYKLFLDHLRRYQKTEPLGLARRLWIALGRVMESEDHELAFAYHCANPAAQAYDRRASIRAYGRRACALYRLSHVRRGLAMGFKAVGLGRPGEFVSRLAWRLLRRRAGIYKRDLNSAKMSL